MKDRRQNGYDSGMFHPFQGFGYNAHALIHEITLVIEQPGMVVIVTMVPTENCTQGEI